MTKLEQEIRFLKNLKKRFDSFKMYKAAIQDMWEEGIITPRAYEYIINEFIPTGTGTILSPKEAVKEATKVLKLGIPKSATKRSYDPCSSGGGFRSSC